ncbi:DUF6289 family protein [Luteimonas aquatica]|uniref:DUF6289 family protein n=1 Tax=Luteimonas aquatica TaxID=450364 RepID=UPI001F576968|nr:DUF6289 family protein [Luteimonas aquatica]
MRKKLVAALGLAAVLAAGYALARPNNGDMGVYLDDQGNVVGTWIVSCEGVFSYSGTRTSNSITNGHLFCNPR